MMHEMKMGEGMTCKCGHHKVLPGIVILFGLLFLLGTLGVVSPEVVNIGWPILVILGGLMKMMQMKCTCC